MFTRRRIDVVWRILPGGCDRRRRSGVLRVVDRRRRYGRRRIRPGRVRAVSKLRIRVERRKRRVVRPQHLPHDVVVVPVPARRKRQRHLRAGLPGKDDVRLLLRRGREDAVLDAPDRVFPRRRLVGFSRREHPRDGDVQGGRVHHVDLRRHVVELDKPGVERHDGLERTASRHREIDRVADLLVVHRSEIRRAESAKSGRRRLRKRPARLREAEAQLRTSREKQIEDAVSLAVEDVGDHAPRRCRIAQRGDELRSRALANAAGAAGDEVADLPRALEVLAHVVARVELRGKLAGDE